MTGNGYRVGQKIAAHTMSKGAADGREFAAAKIVAGDIKSVNTWIATADAKRSWMLVNGYYVTPRNDNPLSNIG
jgi:hypothetical protein